MTRPENFTPAQKRQIRQRSGGICERPGCDRPAVDCNHKHAVCFGGKAELDNGEDLCEACHAIETAKQAADLAKAKRLSGEINPKTGEPFRCQANRNTRYGGRLRSRGFPKARDE